MKFMGKLAFNSKHIPFIAEIISFAATNSFNRRKIFEQRELVSALLQCMESKLEQKVS